MNKNNEMLEVVTETSFYNYLAHRIRTRLKADLSEAAVSENEFQFQLNDSKLSHFIYENQFSPNEIVLLMLALVPHISANFINDILSEFIPHGGDFPEFGGVKGKNYRGVIPTGETALYILAGKKIENRSDLIDYLFYKSSLFEKRILELESVPKGEPFLSGKLILAEEYVHLFLTGKELKPQMSQDFPASLISTDLEWEDLVLNTKTLEDVKEIENWLAYKETLMNDWGMKAKIKPGYRVLFCGLPGTGKTLTAGLLGKYTGKDVYRVDLSMVVSKFIGETEKNLSKLFDKSINQDWILFFDEADAIFGKRTSVRDAHDKYANQEVSYLLQRIEAHPGLIILASNFRNNIDSAFTRRFHNIIEFEAPGYEERILLWKKNLPKNIGLESSITTEELAKKYSITGANIVNVIQYACLKTIANHKEEIQRQYLLEGVKREYSKEGKTININI